MERNVIDFLDACMKVRSEKGASKVLDEWEAALASEPWWVSAGTPGSRLSLMMRHHAAGYLSAKVTEARASKSPKSPKAKGEGSKTPPKPVRVYLGKEPDGEPDASFADGASAQRWAARRVADYTGDTFAVVHDTRFIREPFTRIDKSRAVFLVYGRREAQGGVKVTGSKGGSGPWMKASQDRSSFSRG